MEKELSKCLDPPLLLHLHSLNVNPTISTMIGKVCAGTKTINLLYLKDVLKTWKRHAHPDGIDGISITATPGEIKWSYAAMEISQMPKRVLPDMNALYVERLLKILVTFSEKCTFGRLGDTFVKDSICAELPPSLFASMGHTETPYSKAKQHYGEDMNDIVNAYIRTTPAERMMRTNWKDSKNSTDFIFCACLLLEMMGQEKLAEILKNHELAVYEWKNSLAPHLCVLEGEICMMWGKTIFYIDKDVKYPTATLCFHWVRCAALMGDVAAKSVQCAVQTPDKLSARDPINSFVQ